MNDDSLHEDGDPWKLDGGSEELMWSETTKDRHRSVVHTSRAGQSGLAIRLAKARPIGALEPRTGGHGEYRMKFMIA